MSGGGGVGLPPWWVPMSSYDPQGVSLDEAMRREAVSEHQRAVLLAGMCGIARKPHTVVDIERRPKDIPDWVRPTAAQWWALATFVAFYLLCAVAFVGW